jgi:enoyl-CoA hydratase/carnithine racemase
MKIKTNLTEFSWTLAPKPAEEEVKVVELVKSEKTGNITLIGINRADVRNCVNSETAQQLSHAIETFENDAESPVAILYGVGGNFCSGYDLKELANNKDATATMLLRSEGAMVSLWRKSIKNLSILSWFIAF